jgi:hypothetical protein
MSTDSKVVSKTNKVIDGKYFDLSYDLLTDEIDVVGALVDDKEFRSPPLVEWIAFFKKKSTKIWVEIIKSFEREGYSEIALQMKSLDFTSEVEIKDIKGKAVKKDKYILSFKISLDV